MKLSYTDRIGLNTTGTYGAIILAGVVFDFLSPWWLIPSVFFMDDGPGLGKGAHSDGRNFGTRLNFVGTEYRYGFFMRSI